MREYWVPKYFAKTLESLASQVLAPDIYKSLGVRGLRIMDVGLLKDLDTLRKNLGRPITVNGGGRTQSGVRDLGFYGTPEAYFKSWSMHKYGNALDFVVGGMSAQEVREHILLNKGEYPHITFLETGPLQAGGPMNWVHISSQFLIEDTDILCWSPKLGYIQPTRVISDKL